MPELFHLNRRILLGAAGAGAGLVAAGVAQAAVPLRKLGGDAGKVTIKSVSTFDVVVPQPKGAKPPLANSVGSPGRINVTKVETNAGNGYSFLGSTAEEVAAAQGVLVGNDLFQIDKYLGQGLINWSAIEEAMWDAIGRIAGQPVSRLLGGAALPAVPVYITYTWPGSNRQNAIKPQAQAEPVAMIKAAGFNAMKIQIMRDDFQGDVDACAAILAAGGPGFKVMVDRTAASAGLWSYDTALAAAQALTKVGCTWLEEPLARDDYDGPARLRKEGGGILITGGEAYHGLEPYRQCMLHGTYDVLQPEIRQIAGLWTTRKVGVLAETFGFKMAPHGFSGLAWAGRLQVSAAMGSIFQEIAVLNPPTMPDDLCRPFLALLHGEQPFQYANGNCIVPPHPGLGLNIDEAALKRYRVSGLEALRGPPRPTPGAAPGGQ